MALILPIPAQTPDQLGMTIYKLMQLSKIANETNENEIALDFSNTRFLNSAFISCLYVLINDWRRRGKTVTIGNFNQKVNSYLDAINFPNGYLLDENRDLKQYHSARYTPLVIFPTNGNKREECVGAVLDVVKSQIMSNDQCH